MGVIIIMSTLTRPICFIDLETTGTDTQKSRIVEIAVLKLETDAFTYSVKTRRINPGEPIPAGATAVHGITDEDVASAPIFAQIAAGLHGLIAGCDLAGFCSNQFDIPLLAAEFRRCGIELDYESVNLLDVGNIYKRLNPRTLAAAHLEYVGTDLSGAHSAEADIIGTHAVLKGMLTKHPELPKDITELSLYSNYDKPILDLSGKFTLNSDLEVTYNFGANKGKRVIDDMSYLNWMITANFPPDTTRIAKQIWDKHYDDIAKNSGDLGKEVAGALKDLHK